MIKLFDDWVIVVNDKDYALARYKGTRVDKHGKETPNVAVYGYFGSVSGALRRLSRELVRQGLKSRDTTLTEAVRVIRESNDKVCDLLTRILEDDGK